MGHGIENVYVSKVNRVVDSSFIKGNQRKWVLNSKFIKLNTWKWYEDVSEVLVSYLLKFTYVSYFVDYYACAIYEDGVKLGYGCYSYSFLNEGEICVSFYRMLKNLGLGVTGVSYDEVRDGISDEVGFDIKPYLDRCLCLDAITYNEDRHLRNLSVIKGRSGYREAPVYDNGLACLSDVFTYPISCSLVENLSKVYAKPFSVDFLNQIDRYAKPLVVDYKGFIESVSVETVTEKRAFNVIQEGLKRTEGIAWVRR